MSRRVSSRTLKEIVPSAGLGDRPFGSPGVTLFSAIASQYLDQSHHVLLAITRIDGFFEEAGDQIGEFRVDIGVDALLLDTLQRGAPA